LADLGAKVDQLNEINIDIEKQLKTHTNADVDFENLECLQNRLIESWHNS
jgi:hypothetical protein